jgi:hypothetical protein
VEKLVEQAIDQCRAIERGTAIDRAAMKRHFLTLGGVAAVTALSLPSDRRIFARACRPS